MPQTPPRQLQTDPQAIYNAQRQQECRAANHENMESLQRDLRSMTPSQQRHHLEGNYSEIERIGQSLSRRLRFQVETDEQAVQRMLADTRRTNDRTCDAIGRR